MTGALLAIDAGNTRIKWGVYQHDECLGSGALEHGKVNSLAELCVRYPIRQAVVSNVAGADVRHALEKLLKAMELDALWVTATQHACGVSNSYHVPQQLGSDRWASLIAAWQRDHRACVIVNAGTAITIDALSGEGIFMGGLILPGLHLMKSALEENTAQLEQVSGTLTLFPQSTSDAMYNGAIMAIIGAVVQMLETLQKFEGVPPLLLLSGGDALILRPLLADKVALTLDIVDNLVLEGLVLLHREMMHREEQE
jgi:type III pantothenate kinase